MNTAELLFTDYLEPDPTDPAITSYRLRGSQIPVWRVMARMAARSVAIREVAAEFGVYWRSIEAAITFATRHREAFAWRITSENCKTAEVRPPPPPWWLDSIQFIGVAMLIAALLLMLELG